MTSTPFFKAFTGLFVSFALASQCQAQANYGYQQQYTPSYYYYNQPGQYYQQPAQGYYPGQTYNYGRYQTAPQPPAQQSYQPTQPAPKSTKAQKRSSGSSASENNSGWMTDWNAAWAKARKQGRPLVTIFVHHGCPECDKLDATLSNPEALHTLDNAVKCRVEFTANPEVVNRFGVKLTPTFIVLSPAHNGEVYREVGALTLDRLQTLKPSIDSLVTAPEASGDKPELSSKINDDASSRTVVSI